MAHLEATQAAVAKAEAELREASCTERSRDRAVEVTVGPQGELQDVRFLDGKYRNMGASELAASVLEAVEQARSHMAHRVMDTFKPLTDANESVPGLPGIDIDWEKIFPQALEDDEESDRPARRRRRSGLHDEISEEDDLA